MTTQNLNKSVESETFNKKHILIVYAHHEPKSFNGALLRTAVESLESNGHTVEVSDLYAMEFEPRTQRSDIKGPLQDHDFFKYQMETKTAYENNCLSDDIKMEIEKLKRADLVIFQFPLYWFSYPAIMKGWFDRVFVLGFAFDLGKLYHEGPMKGKKAMLSMTLGGPEVGFSSAGLHGDINVHLWPMQNGNLKFVGFDVLAPHVLYAIEKVTDEERKTWLSDWSKRLKNIFGEKPIDFVHVSKFKSLSLKDDYIEEQKSNQYAPSVGYHLGKPLRPNCMMKPS